MKKIIPFALAVTFVTLLHSCQKQDELVAPGTQPASVTPSADKLTTTRPAGISFTLSDWFSVPLIPVPNGSLYGYHKLSKPVTGTADTDTALAYIRRNEPGDGSPHDKIVYLRMPAVMSISTGENVDISFALGTQLFELMISPWASTPIILHPSDFNNCTYRYIVLSKKDFANKNIDWDDYLAVVLALGFAP